MRSCGGYLDEYWIISTGNTMRRINKNIKTHKLKTYYLKLGILAEVDIDTLQKEFKLTRYGASCLLYMYIRGEYCPELENVYLHKEAQFLIDKREGEARLIEFVEDMPPFKKYGTYYKELAEVDKDNYVTIGVATFVTFEEYRQKHIHLYVECNRILEQVHADMREALANGDGQYFIDFFKRSDKNKIVEQLQQESFKPAEIKRILELMKRGDRN